MVDNTDGVQAQHQWQGYLIYTAPVITGTDRAPPTRGTLYGNEEWNPHAILAELCAPIEIPYRVTSDERRDLFDGRYQLLGAWDGV